MSNVFINRTRKCMDKQVLNPLREKQFNVPRYGKHRTKSDNLSQNKGKPKVKAALICFAIVLIILVVFRNDNLLSENSHLSGTAEIGVISSARCQSLPTHGSAYVLEPSFMKRSDVLYSGLEILNTHDHPMVLILSDISGARQFLASSIAADKTVQFSVPVGQYGIQVFVGSNWCNLESGFSDGAKISVDGGIFINAGQTTLLEFYGTGLNPVQIALAHSTTRPVVNPERIKPPSEVIGNDALELLQSHEGHYFSSGTVNGVPIVFMIDTGATTVSISSKIAARAGIKKCVPVNVSTANGIVDACVATVSEVTFGNYRVTDVDVTVLPNMFGDALLGMNVLRNFRIEQVDEVMRISSR